MGVPRPYADRHAAGIALADALASYQRRDDLVVLALPRGGVPVAAPVADALRAPLDVLVVRKLGTPQNPELAMGAITAVGDTVEVIRNEGVLDRVAVAPEDFDQVYRAELLELRRRTIAYRAGRSPAPMEGRVAVIVDDGLATGSTMRVAVLAARRQRASAVVIAVPAGSSRTCTALRTIADDLVCAWIPSPFSAVRQAYADFSETTDEEVLRVLHRAAARERSVPGPA